MSWKATAYVKPLKKSPDGSDLTRSEKLLLLILADYHNEEQRGAWPSGNALARDALISLRHVRTLLLRLRQKGIICISQRLSNEGDPDTNLYHFHALDCDENHKGGSELSSLPVVKPVHHVVNSLVHQGSEPIGSPGVVNSGGRAYKDEPPEGTAIEPPHTHGREPSLFDEPTAEPERVCVSEDLSLKDYLGYARSQASIHSPEGWAMKHFAQRDADVLVREWLDAQRPEAIAAARAAPSSQNLFFDEAAHRVRTLLPYGQDAQAIIDSMPLDDDVRQRLVEKFVNGR